MLPARRLGLSLVAAALLPAAPALAQTPMVEGYAPPGGGEQSQITPPPAPAASPSVSGSSVETVSSVPQDTGDVKGEVAKSSAPAGSGRGPAHASSTPSAPTAAAAAPDTASGGSSLPFTGLDARLVALLVLVGLGTRRLATRAR